MAAVLHQFFDYGGTDGSPSSKDVDGIGPPELKMKTADNWNIDNVNPIPKPPSGLNYSYWKQVYLECMTAPNTSCNNFRWYTDGSGFGTGIALKIGVQFPIRTKLLKTGYDVATGVVGESGDVMTDHSDITSSVDAFGKVVGAPMVVSCNEDGNLINAIGETTNFIVLQAEVGPTAVAGTKDNETITWKWDEV
jgi:hypothetical protein